MDMQFSTHVHSPIPSSWALCTTWRHVVSDFLFKCLLFFLILLCLSFFHFNIAGAISHSGFFMAKECNKWLGANSVGILDDKGFVPGFLSPRMCVSGIERDLCLASCYHECACLV
jgi:hypothetical protein